MSRFEELTRLLAGRAELSAPMLAAEILELLRSSGDLACQICNRAGQRCDYVAGHPGPVHCTWVAGYPQQWAEPVARSGAWRNKLTAPDDPLADAPAALVIDAMRAKALAEADPNPYGGVARFVRISEADLEEPPVDLRAELDEQVRQADLQAAREWAARWFEPT